MSDVTRILFAIEQGDAAAVDQLLPIVYDELRAIARNQMKRERADHTLQPTALVHEAYLKLVGGEALASNSRSYFFAAAAEAMRRILIDRARAKAALKRGGDDNLDQTRTAAPGSHPRRLQLDQLALTSEDASPELLDLDDALTRFAALEPEKAELVKLRFFAGLTLDEAAGVLNISSATADRHWRYARAWLFRELNRR